MKTVNPDTTTPWFAVRDAKVEAFAPPFASINEETAKRAFTAEANDPASSIHQFAEDYSLWFVGYYDQEQGCFHPTKSGVAEHLVGAVQVRRSKHVFDERFAKFAESLNQQEQRLNALDHGLQALVGETNNE